MELIVGIVGKFYRIVIVRKFYGIVGNFSRSYGIVGIVGKFYGIVIVGKFYGIVGIVGLGFYGIVGLG